MKKTVISFVLVFVLSSFAYAASNATGNSGINPGNNAGSGHGAGQGTGPCAQIEQACIQAGFKQGDWKNGDGLWRDCVDPIIQGVTTVPGGTKPLPTVDPKLIAECKVKRPKFGEGKVGSK